MGRTLCDTEPVPVNDQRSHNPLRKLREEQQWAGHGRFNVTWPLTLGSVPNGSPPAHLAQRGY